MSEIFSFAWEQNESGRLTSRILDLVRRFAQADREYRQAMRRWHVSKSDDEWYLAKRWDAVKDGCVSELQILGAELLDLEESILE